MTKIAVALGTLIFLQPIIFSPDTYASVSRESSQQLFKRSAAYTALRERKYPEASKEVDTLLSERPRDPYLLKMKGMILYKQGRKKKARKFLHRALKMNPFDRQARFYLGKISLEQKDLLEARQQFIPLIEQPDNSEYYSQQARGWLKKLPTPAKPAARKRWKFYGNVGYFYDDNVPLRSSVDEFKRPVDRNGQRFRVEDGLRLDHLRSKNFRLGTSYSVSQSFHTDALHTFNYRYHSLRNDASFVKKVFHRPLSFGVIHNFGHGTLKYETLSSSNDFLFWSTLGTTSRTEVSLFNTTSFSNFREKGFNPSISSRSGVYNNSGILGALYLGRRDRALLSGYEFGYSQTDGNDFDSMLHLGRVIFKTPVIERVRLETGFSFGYKNHYNFSVLPHRQEFRMDYKIILSRPFWKYFELRAIYNYNKVNALYSGTLGIFDYSKNVIGGEIGYEF